MSSAGQKAQRRAQQQCSVHPLRRAGALGVLARWRAGARGARGAHRARRRALKCVCIRNGAAVRLLVGAGSSCTSATPACLACVREGRKQREKSSLAVAIHARAVALPIIKRASAGVYRAQIKRPPPPRFRLPRSSWSPAKP